MKIEKALKSSANYPANIKLKPIIFTVVSMIALNGCSNNLSPHKVVKPEAPIYIDADKNNTGDVEPVEPAIAGLMLPVQPVKPPKK